MSHPAEETVDHYKFWVLERISFTRTVHTRGQFDVVPRRREITSLDLIGNPVSKNGGKVKFPDLHLTGYAVDPPGVPEKRRSVFFSNQFTEKAEWRLGDPTLLLLPAGKSFAEGKPVEPKPPYTHYLCYKVERGEVVNRTVELSDQFDSYLGIKEKVGPLYPELFAVPVEKNDEPIGNKKVHLAIYGFQPNVGLPNPIYIRTSDQFIPLLPVLEQVIGPRMLAVPSFKLDWTEIP